MNLDRLLRKYLEGSISSEELKELREMVEQAPEIQAELRRTLELRSAIHDDLLRLSPPASLSDNVRNSVAMRFAALAEEEAPRVTIPGIEIETEERPRRRRRPLAFVERISGGVLTGALALMLVVVGPSFIGSGDGDRRGTVDRIASVDRSIPATAPNASLPNATASSGPQAGGTASSTTRAGSARSAHPESLIAASGSTRVLDTDSRTSAAERSTSDAGSSSAERSDGNGSTVANEASVPQAVPSTDLVNVDRSQEDRGRESLALNDGQTMDRGGRSLIELNTENGSAEGVGIHSEAATVNGLIAPNTSMAGLEAAIALNGGGFNGEGSPDDLAAMRERARLFDQSGIYERERRAAEALDAYGHKAPNSVIVADLMNDDPNWRRVAFGVTLGSGSLAGNLSPTAMLQNSYYLSFGLSRTDMIGMEMGGSTFIQHERVYVPAFGKDNALAKGTAGGDAGVKNGDVPVEVVAHDREFKEQITYGAIFYDRRFPLSERWDVCGRVGVGGANDAVLGNVRAYAAYSVSENVTFTLGVGGSALHQFSARNESVSGNYAVYYGVETGF